MEYTILNCDLLDIKDISSLENFGFGVWCPFPPNNALSNHKMFLDSKQSHQISYYEIAFVNCIMSNNLPGAKVFGNENRGQGSFFNIFLVWWRPYL